MIQVVTLVSAVAPGIGMAFPQCRNTAAGLGSAAAGCTIALAAPDSTSEALIPAAQASEAILILLMASDHAPVAETALQCRRQPRTLPRPPMPRYVGSSSMSRVRRMCRAQYGSGRLTILAGRSGTWK